MSPGLKTTMAIASFSLASPDSVMAIVPNQLRNPHLTAPAVPVPAGELDLVMVFGAIAVVLTLFCRSHEHVFRWLAVGTVVGAMIAAVYGFIVGAWPLGLAVGAYSIARFHSTYALRARGVRRRGGVSSEWSEQSRIERMFGRR
jgi:hypothetical protein